MPPFELGLAVLALLLTPGPTNSLMLLAGVERGFAGAARLIPAEVLGYFLTILPLALIGVSVLERHPDLRRLVILAAGAWVAVLAIRLWQVPALGTERPVVGARVLVVTTALNPKALIFGLVLLPSPDHLARNLAVFAALVVLVALVWAWIGAGLGTGLQRGAMRGPRALFLFRRLAAVWLAAISVTLAVRGIGA